MSIRKPLFSLSLILALVFSNLNTTHPAIAQTDDDCPECRQILIEGTRDVIKFTDNSSFEKSVQTWMNSKDSLEYYNKYKNNFGMGITVDDAPVGFEFGSASDYFIRKRNELNKGKNTKLDKRTAISILTQIANKDIIQRWSECIESCHSANSIVSATVRENGNTIVFTVKYNPPSTKIKEPVVEYFHVVGGKIISPVIKKGVNITSGGVSQLIQRTGSNDITISLQTNYIPLVKFIKSQKAANEPEIPCIDSKTFADLQINLVTFKSEWASKHGGDFEAQRYAEVVAERIMCRWLLKERKDNLDAARKSGDQTAIANAERAVTEFCNGAPGVTAAQPWDAPPPSRAFTAPSTPNSPSGRGF